MMTKFPGVSVDAEHRGVNPEPWFVQVTLCEQLDIYLRKFVSTAAEKPTATAPGAEAAQIDGYVVRSEHPPQNTANIGTPCHSTAELTVINPRTFMAIMSYLS
jgi:hypothetical protein